MMKTNTSESVSFSSIYKAYDISNVHVNSFYLNYIQSSKVLKEQSNIHLPTLFSLGKNK